MKYSLDIATIHGLLLCLFVTASACNKQNDEQHLSQQLSDQDLATSDLGKLWQERAHNVQTFGRGRVLRILADDNKGDRHQRFIVELPTRQTLLIAHNIDLAGCWKTPSVLRLSGRLVI
ncbi:DUF3465 domain-containing protein [Gilvimarinus sp. SDUM040013]|uniref:DUF3465 domain-containing protein n=1 Tax=Gilvimarinus gilvus TaxID=3058038 RepID=A0ABU4RXH2_9GAMM|nr:DUF3465 domain-containing protein [Gilvimarinus sp. SDUM040013]MDO3387713.1 DUF3465 domain-containing protein [Gilvimarinus sp. SDUM040013]MDX6848846.1 DUF3465 domain-containing protein [Gilvimarinus sp. SDUM040013]